ncbi:uncharacterized protein BT62DRAFT_1072747 [Guyanagaster necrorhizus]|uniref:Uncharacterized protein n=1 Tax=Guyanagaster necrorhizus TaxID=856835 RepID=A0A9P7W1Y9_9AGAR|nr:uncharacterized protein BT62DRAFT_1072747 [Guyanagaster necrorhizus MCA 3950]KAG7450713.1 hypothetical protein BT62DRAFT_1072747 [Guyanagaster necrorhizus MCA 3950]
MWCTRWFLPLLLLPLPTAPPYFLLLFLLSLTMHAKPCFYCIILITSLFISSCYRQPFSLDTPLTSPWAENITTYSHALSASLSSLPRRTLMPTTIRAVDRCWCDLSSGAFFEPFNMSRWEHNTVNRLKDDLEHQWKAESANATIDIAQMNEDFSPSDMSRNIVESIWSMITRSSSHSRASAPVITDTLTGDYVASDAEARYSLFHRQHDLRPYGVDMRIDLSWSGNM